MEIFDIFLKAALVRSATSLPKATASAIASRQQILHDYLLKVFDAPIAIQIAVRDASAASESLDERKLSRIVTALLSPLFTAPAVTELATGAVFLPSSTFNVLDASRFLPSGSFVFNSGKLIHYTGKTGNQFTGCTTTATGSVQGGNVITQAGVPSAAEVSANRAEFRAAFTRRSQNTIGALNFINEKHIWSWNKLQP